MRTRIFIILLAVTAGCTKRLIEIPTKFGPVKYDSSRFGNKESIKEVVFTAPDGSSLTIKGFSGNQVDALEAVAEGTARGTAQGLTGGATAYDTPTGFKVVPKDDPSVSQLEYPDKR